MMSVCGCILMTPYQQARAFSFSADEEIKIGKKIYQKTLSEYGRYSGNGLDKYIETLGNTLVRVIGKTNIRFTFTLLDTDMVNAFATPGGYVYLTRGILALAETEAEIAGVISHEIGHITARHASKQYGKSQWLDLGLGALSTILGGATGEIAQQIGGVGGYFLMASWSRDQEHEADDLAVKYMTRAGFDPRGMAILLDKMRNDSRLRFYMAGKNASDADNQHFLDTHPATPDRVKRIETQGKQFLQQEMYIGRNPYLKRIEGMVYGENSSDQGWVDGQKFIHPSFGIAFHAPQGFKLTNKATAVQGIHKNGSVMIYDLDEANNFSPADYITHWAKHKPLHGLEPITIGDFTASSGKTETKVNVRGKTQDMIARLVAIRDGNHMHRLSFLAPRNLIKKMDPIFRESALSFHRVDKESAKRMAKTLRIRLHQVRPGETAETIAKLMKVNQFSIELWEVINGRSRRWPLTPDEWVKVIAP